MHFLHLAFPLNLDPPAARSLSLLFILQEFLSFCKVTQQTSPKESQLLQTVVAHPFAKKENILHRLYFYCEILIESSQTREVTILDIIDEMRGKIDNIRLKWKNQLPNQEEFATLLHELRFKLASFFSSLYPFLQQSRTNENILLYLIEHRQEFNLHLGPNTILNLLGKFFPAGLFELRATICEGYTRRGFNSFYQKLEILLDHLEREIFECPSQSPKP